MDQPSVMGRGQGGEHRIHQLQGSARSHRRFPIEHVPQGLPLDILHHDVGPAVGALEVLTLIKDRDHVRV